MKNTFSNYWKQSTLSENITKSELDAIEDYADRLFAAVGVDVELHGRHFYDRLNDARNGKDITKEELIELFKKTFKKYGQPISKMKPGLQAVIKDFNTNINIPFMLKWNKQNKDLDLIAKTIMRKRDFRTSNRILKI